MKKQKYNRELIISQILSFNAVCTQCGFVYTYNYLSALTTLKLLSICKNPNLKIFEHEHTCYKKYKHSLTVKACVKCGKEMNKRDSSNICKECRRIEQLTRTCKLCGKTVILSSGRQKFEFCDECWNSGKAFEHKLNNIQSIEQSISDIVYSYKNDLSNLFFDKFFNKIDKTTFDKSIQIKEWRKLQYQKHQDIYIILNKFIQHLTNSYYEFHWSLNTIKSLMICLQNVLNKYDGFVLTESIGQISLETELFGWKNLLKSDLQSVFKSLHNFLCKTCKGKGEFFWIIINKNSQCNYLGSGDVLYKNNTLGELKCSCSKTEAGRLLFKRDSWFGFNNFEQFKLILQNQLLNWFYKHYQSIEILNYIQKITQFSPDMFTWDNSNSVYNTCLNLIDNNTLKNDFIKFIFTLTINNKEFKSIRFNNLDLTNKENFKIFHFMNFCLYYILEDAKHENLDQLIFSSNMYLLILSKTFLLTASKEEFLQKISNWEIAYPDSGFTKEKNESHDRNKNRAPGIYFKQKELN